MHPDAQTNIRGVEYFFFRAGPLCVAVQWSRNPACSPYGILLARPEDFPRKEATWLFHPELGLSKTTATVTADGERYNPGHADVEVRWESADPESPVVSIRWHAGDIVVRERLFPGELQKRSGKPHDVVDRVQTDTGLIREIHLEPANERAPLHQRGIAIELALYPNPYRFHALPAPSHTPHRFIAGGICDELSLATDKDAVLFERFVTVEVDRIGRIDSPVRFEYAVPTQPSGTEQRTEALHSVPARPESATTGSGEFTGRLLRQFGISRTGLRGVVADNGSFDASVWQYGYEWAQDAAIVASAASYAGDFPTARTILQNILTRLSDDHGNAMESSRFRDGELSELNANGAVLIAVRDYAAFSGDEPFVHRHRQRIIAVADRVGLPLHRHETGLIGGTRDLWERLPWMGLEPGFDTATNTYCAKGLEAAAELAGMIDASDEGEIWSRAGRKIREVMTGGGAYSIVEDGRIVHRRLLNGSVQRTMTSSTGYHDSRYSPYVPAAVDNPTPRPCDPDSTSALPMVYGIVDAGSETARATLDHLHAHLWNRTGIGGYLRSPLLSDPDSPGPWPFVTAWMAEAELKAGIRDRATESTEWLLDMAGSGGSWFEYYGERETPPFPPTGVIVWGWAQYILLVLRGWMGIECSSNSLRIAPRTTGFSHTIAVGSRTVRLTVEGLSRVAVDGIRVERSESGIEFALPLERDHRVEWFV